MTAGTNVPIDAAEVLVGLPVATVVVAVVLVLGLALHRRILVLGRELTALVDSHERELAQLEDRADEMKADRDWWRSTAVTALDLGERAVAVRQQDE